MKMRVDNSTHYKENHTPMNDSEDQTINPIIVMTHLPIVAMEFSIAWTQRASLGHQA